MNNEIKKLMNVVLEKFGGLFKRENQRTYWESPIGEKFHVSTVFLRRMAAKPAPEKKETLDVVQPKQEEVLLNGVTEFQPESRSEEVTETHAKVEEERVVTETPKKKKKDRKKKTEPQMENEAQQGQEVKVKEQE